MAEYKTVRSERGRSIRSYEVKFNLGFAIATLLSGLFTWASVELRQVLLIETGILLFTTFLTVVTVNLIIDKFSRPGTNTWLYVSSPSKVAGQICEHRPSMLKDEKGKPTLLSRFLKKGWSHFLIILPSLIVFYIVMAVGLVGYQGLDSASLSLVNFAPDISWLFWFPLLWILTWLANGRAWCMTCPFSGQAEWVHRMHPWKKLSKKLGKNIRWPVRYSTILYSAVGFVVLTWMEEFYGIGGPGVPALTSVVLIYIAALELGISLLFQERTFCRTICPLSAPLAVNTMISPLGTFESVSHEKCSSCTTKDCMKGNNGSHGCPWFASPGSRETSPFCGLAGDCYRSCPHDNIDWRVRRFPWIDGLYVLRKRVDVAASVLLLLGVVIFQFVNALPMYSYLDGILNGVTGWSTVAGMLTPGLSNFGYSTNGYPNPLDYTLISLAPLLVTYGLTKGSKLGFVSVSYSLVPLFAAGILARNIPKFFGGAPLILNEILNPFGSPSVNLHSTFWGSVLYYLGGDPSSATAEWWVMPIMEGILAFGTYLSVRASLGLSRQDDVPLKYYLFPVLLFSILLMGVTWFMCSPNDPSQPFYIQGLGNLLYSPLQAQPPF